MNQQPPPAPPPSSAFWDPKNVRHRLEDVQHTINLAKAMEKELEALIRLKGGEGSTEAVDDEAAKNLELSLTKCLEDNRVDLATQELLSLQAANAIMLNLGAQLEPFRVVADEASPWEEKSAAARLANKMQKWKRNKKWRKRKRKMVAERLAKERSQFDLADQEADEWRAREIAKDIAKRKVEKLKEVAKVKAKEEKKRLESELELVLIVEKLQELPTLRIQKLKKQGHFLPEEDDKFLERVRAAVEEEERLVSAAANTDSAKDAIASAEESRTTIQGRGSDLEVVEANKTESMDNKEEITVSESKEVSDSMTHQEYGKEARQTHGGAYNSVGSLPIEFYHYYHGSSNDMGTLIEVRRTWDQYIRPGGSRIPGHWPQPPTPADEIWASYLVKH